MMKTKMKRKRMNALVRMTVKGILITIVTAVICERRMKGIKIAFLKLSMQGTNGNKKKSKKVK